MHDLLWDIFDDDWYLARYPMAALAVAAGDYPDAFTHYICVGARENLQPSRLFDPAYYASANRDAAEAVERGDYQHLAHHFVIVGRHEGRIGSPALPHGEMADWMDDLTPRTAMAITRENILYGLEKFAAQEFYRQVIKGEPQAA